MPFTYSTRFSCFTQPFVTYWKAYTRKELNPLSTLYLLTVFTWPWSLQFPQLLTPLTANGWGPWCGKGLGHVMNNVVIDILGTTVDGWNPIDNLMVVCTVICNVLFRHLPHRCWHRWVLLSHQHVHATIGTWFGAVAFRSETSITWLPPKSFAQRPKEVRKLKEQTYLLSGWLSYPSA